MAKRYVRRKFKPERVALVLLVPVVLIAGIIFGLVKLFSPSPQTKPNMAEVTTEKTAQKESGKSENPVNKSLEDHPNHTEQNQGKEHEQEIAAVKNTPAGQVVDVADLTRQEIQNLFYAEPVSDELISSMEGKTWVSGQDFISPSDLRLIRILYKDYNGQDCAGELIVNEKIAEDTIGVFRDLYEAEYPIGQVILPDYYNGDDNQSMTANNTSGFSFRLSDGVGIAIHEHSLGLAIDINPLQNPQIIEKEDGSLNVIPYSSLPWSDRTEVQEHMITHDDPAYQIFTKHGFSWGGDWPARQDYMHFEKDYDSSMFKILG